jgi:hypothetical protein
LLSSVFAGAIDIHEEGVYPVVCWACAGSGCHFCKKSGTIKLKEKPNSLISSKAEIYFSQYAALKNYKIWPYNVGYMQQESKFVKIMEFCDKIINRIQSEQAEIAKAQAALRDKQRAL